MCANPGILKSISGDGDIFDKMNPGKIFGMNLAPLFRQLTLTEVDKPESEPTKPKTKQTEPSSQRLGSNRTIYTSGNGVKDGALAVRRGTSGTK